MNNMKIGYMLNAIRKNNMKNIEVIIPLGITGPNNDMPNKDFLIFGLEKLKHQTIPVKITCAIDENLQEDRKEIINKYADKIKEFPKNSYFKPGGIWKKIWKCWKESDCKYIAWNGYDDYSDIHRFKLQYDKLEQTNTNSCFCSNYVDKGKRIGLINNGNINFKETIGIHALYMGSYLLRRDAILNSGLGDYEDKWSYYFEGLLNTFILKTGKPVIETYDKFVYREHLGTISETCKEHEEWVQKAIQDVGYTFEDCRKDWESINFNKISEDIKGSYK
jgi:hypothetical protein